MSDPKISVIADAPTARGEESEFAFECPERMCQIPAGKFKMGSTNGEPNEQPVREVELSAYALQKHEVTVWQYRAYLAEKYAGFQAVIRGCGEDDYPRVLGVGKTRSKAAGLLPKVDGKDVCEAKIVPHAHAFMPELSDCCDHFTDPMTEVSWHEARAFCQFYGMDLPTEAQWERGARGLAGNYNEVGTYTGEAEIEAHFGKAGDSIITDITAAVCRYAENDLGLCDMAGNVEEWTLDWYQADAYKSMEPKDPKGPADGKHKVVRGGCWANDDPRDLRASRRNYARPSERSIYIGFRCVSPALSAVEGVPKESKK